MSMNMERKVDRGWNREGMSTRWKSSDLSRERWGATEKAISAFFTLKIFSVLKKAYSEDFLPCPRLGFILSLS